MANFNGRADDLAFFTDGERGVVIDSKFGVVVASGKASVLQQTATWGAGEYSDPDAALADSALSLLDSEVSAPTGRMYTVPKGVQNKARHALKEWNSTGRGGTDVSTHIAEMLAQGGQVDFNQICHISKYFGRHRDEKFSDTFEPVNGMASASQITWDLWGGDTADQWSNAIVSREAEKALTADAVVVPNVPESAGDPFVDGFTLDPNAGPEFMARIRMDGSGIDRLYRIDPEGEVYVWDDGQWDNLGSVAGDVYYYDKSLDDPSDTVEKDHVVIDPASAVVIGAYLQNDPYSCVSLDDIDSYEARLAIDAIPGIDWGLADTASPVVADAGGMVGYSDPSEYTPQERSANASKQPRTGDGRFATTGMQVMVGSNPANTGKITQVNAESGTVNVQLDSGSSVTVPSKAVQGVGTSTAVPTSGPVGSVSKVDFSGILAEPRQPINQSLARIPGTLPAMTTNDLHTLLNNWPAWVQAQRNAFVPAPGVGNVPVDVVNPNKPDLGTAGRALVKASKTTLYTDPYQHPLLADWLRKADAGLVYKPVFSIQASGDNAEPDADSATQPTELTPENSDVKPVYLAVVAPDDPTAVTALLALVPANSTSNEPMAYSRDDGQWNRDVQALHDLQSATPPPVVPLDPANYDQVLSQVDSTQQKNDDQKQTEEQDSEDATTQVVPGPPIVPAAGAAKPVTAAALVTLDQASMILWGPLDELQPAMTAAGGADRNRGQAEKLRHYWEHGAGAAKILWNTPGDWTRCYRHLAKYLGPRAKGYCSLRHKEMTGMWPGDKANREGLSANPPTPSVLALDSVESEDVFVTNVTAEARIEDLHARIAGLSSMQITGKTDQERWDSANQKLEALTSDGSVSGASFIIPLVLPLGIETGDGRIIDQDADIDLRNLPLPLLWQVQTASGHDGSYVVGRIDTMEITPTGVRNAKGVLDTGPMAQEAERMLRAGFLRGVSADMDMFEAQEEIELADDGDDDKGDTIKSKKIVVNQTRIMGVTIVAKPAFQECQIFLTDNPAQDDEENSLFPDGEYVDDVNPLEASALIAAGYVAEHVPVAPPKTWFSNPRLDQKTPITVEDDGRVFGHIATWDTDHIGHMGRRITPPHSMSNYAYFQTGVLRTEEGSDINVGQLTLAGGHADLTFSAREAVKHYDDTASAVADVQAGEDRYGIWVAGALRPGVTPQQVRVLRASAPSGDWRPIKGKLELVAVCQVNVPGFPIARTLVAGGQTLAVVAAGAYDLAQLKSDPVSEITARLDRLEQFTTAELSQKIDPVREKFAAFKADRDAELAAKAEDAAVRMSALTDFAYIPQKTRDKLADKGQAMPDGSFPIRNVSDLHNAIHAYGRASDDKKAAVRRHIIKRARALGETKAIPDSWTQAANAEIESILSARSNLAEFASSQEKDERRRRIEDIARQVDPNIVNQKTVVDSPDKVAPKGTSQDKGEMRPKYTPKTQPRDESGKFRLILARLRSDIGVSGNQEVMQKVKKAENLVNAGNYQAASTSYADLVNALHRIDTKSMDAHSIGTLKSVSRDLAKVVANLPLPFDDQSQKIRFSDLPPVLQEMFNQLASEVQDKYGKDKGGKQTAQIRNFMSGGDYYSQSNVSSQLNHLLHLLS